MNVVCVLYITGSIASRYLLPIACQRPQKKEVQGIILKCEHAQSSGLQASQLVREGGRQSVKFLVLSREMENIVEVLPLGILSISSHRGPCRTLRLQDHRVHEYRLPCPPSFLNVMYCVRVSLRTAK
jgi:hypothetical protein